MKKMASFRLYLLLLAFLVGVLHAVSDFQDSRWNVDYVYHENHELLLAIFHDTDSCYFTNVDDTTKRAFENCHREYLEDELYDAVQWEDQNVVIPTTLDVMREQYHDVFAEFRCAGKKIYILNVIFGEDYIKQCNDADLAGK